MTAPFTSSASSASPASSAPPSGARASWRPFLALIRQTRPSVPVIACALVLSLATAGAGLVVPMMTRRLVDGFSFSDIRPLQIAFLVGVFLLQAASSGIAIFLMNKVGQRVVYRLRDRLWAKLLRLPVSEFDRSRTGELISRMTNDTGIVRSLISEHLSTLVSSILSIVGSVVLLFVLDWRMTLLLLVAVPLTVGALVPLGRAMIRISRSIQDENASFTNVLAQVLSEIRLVKSSGAEPLEYERGRGGIRRLFRLGVKEGLVTSITAPLMSIVIMALLVVVVGYGGMRVSSGGISTGELVAFVLYLLQIVFPLSQLTTFFTQFQKAVGATERLIDLLGQPEEDYDSGQPVPSDDREIRVDGVTFSYGYGEPVLRDVSFAIPPGKVTALVGPSGSGKTTLFALLDRYYEPGRGVIRFGGTPISDYRLPEWRSRIGYVSQESPLVSGSVRDNIAYGLQREIGDEELRRAAAMANADRFVAELPDGDRTEVGERGLKLSGGQRQRIGIARALLRDPRILMLDEATSSLDSQSEAAVQDALSRLMRGRTTIVIAHRLSTVVDADQIVFLDHGRVTGIGTHEELYRGHPLYRRFADQQFRERAPQGDRTGTDNAALQQLTEERWP
ncbi:ABC transporter ATP-binding protein [Cohnella sp. REN36]|uniref:ABC transporter ATP-binding protein n=1 Tax=Cohnella sp. REN36 TaxID=2887347 RepID=UPI001D1589B3|nr:ABC transporter ATP-binding protein [Cohnella sp. REN36]MCC3373091.1 ABC transporter ATP-binding protein/permease [Cohnella sp. REN36]